MKWRKTTYINIDTGEVLTAEEVKRMKKNEMTIIVTDIEKHEAHENGERIIGTTKYITAREPDARTQRLF